MDVQRLKLDQLVNLLIQKSGLSMGELAGLIGVSRQTLSNWRSGRIEVLDPRTQSKIDKALSRNKEWGIKLGNISHAHIEIINSSDNSATSNKSPHTDNELRDLVFKYQQDHIKRLEDEIMMLKEQVEQYKSKLGG